MAEETDTTITSKHESSPSDINREEENRKLCFVVQEMNANMRHIEAHVITLTHLTRTMLKSQRRATELLERDVHSMLSLFQRGRREEQKHLPAGLMPGKG
ncbi:MAG: hypothetical protein ACR2OR_13770 [Hyphomicrobiales bacterium]